jgi:hypothetical protein
LIATIIDSCASRKSRSAIPHSRICRTSSPHITKSLDTSSLPGIPRGTTGNADGFLKQAATKIDQESHFCSFGPLGTEWIPSGPLSGDALAPRNLEDYLRL